MKFLLSAVVLALGCSLGSAEPQKRFIDIYIYETRRLDGTMTFYSWIGDNGGGDCKVEDPVPEFCIGWLQAGPIYIENKGGSSGKGISGQSMVLITIAEPDKNWFDGGSGKGVKISFGRLKEGEWDGNINIEVPYKSTYEVRRTVNVKKEK